MGASRRVSCHACEQTFISDAQADCPLCGAASGLLDPASLGGQAGQLAKRSIQEPNDDGPTVNGGQSHRKPWQYLIILIPIIAIALIVLLFSRLFEGRWEPHSEYSKHFFTGEPVEQLRANDLAEIVKQDRDAAHTRFQNRGIQLTGKVTMWDANARNGSIELLLDSEAVDTPFVVVEAPARAVSQFSQVKMSDVITVKGLCRGISVHASGVPHIWIMGSQLVAIVEKAKRD